eukprot:TRINITY_DN12975_c0_g1_i1.p1 TRINITY_DN12975_c0_g1~~TRINITY_DN12975_c0_g1_i1.p1  ORF type:complete len:371 (+),score=-89.56 TRINITY_DN12975_c0_g1_i1:228-1340(+)
MLLRIVEEQARIFFEGAWVIDAIPEMQAASAQVVSFVKTSSMPAWEFDFSQLTALDTAGAVLVSRLLAQLEKSQTVQPKGLSKDFAKMLSLISPMRQEVRPKTPITAVVLLSFLGAFICQRMARLYAFLTFFGELAVVAGRVLFSRVGRVIGIGRAIEETGVNALSIVGLMAFLVGIVLAYQLSDQLSHYGASIFLVDVAGVAIFREFSPLITAIIVAGRTATAFTAAIGTMKVSEEIAALNTMGISPFERLILPKVLGLLCALPLLTIWSDIFGVLGSMVMASWSAHLTTGQFLERFSQVVGVRQLLLGLMKTPIFALVIASIGCFQGLLVQATAESIGGQTTRAAVQSIFFIIVLDAAFSVFFTLLGW